MNGVLIPLLLAGIQSPPVIHVPVPAQVEQPDIDWARLPDLPYRLPPQITPPMNAYVKAQTKYRRCPVQRRVADKRPALRIEVAVLVHPDDGVRATIPRAAGCPVVEQYAAGLVTAFARNNLSARTSAAEQWYRSTVTFLWRE